ncbi:MAG: RnfABCDGE type electron transport complex subunit G [Deltaproteobacteria bacterium]|nr:RnfABCDGE type electron transport complex subunit G [Deltaproteobacteria bacterium]
MSTEDPKAPAEAPAAAVAAPPPAEAPPQPSVEAAPPADRPAEKIPESGSVAEGIKMVLTVALFTLLSGALLGFVYRQAKPRIDAAKLPEKIAALANILPDFDNAILDTGRCADPDGAPLGDACRRTMYTALRDGRPVGYALETYTTAGYGPRIDLLIGCSADYAVTGTYVLSQQETPGLGAKIVEGHRDWKNAAAVAAADRPFILQFAGKRLGAFDFRVRKDGGQVDAITASTISSRAVAGAIEEALTLLRDRTCDGEATGGTP